MGAEGAGKPSTVNSLLDKKFQKNQESTIGAAVNHFACVIDPIFVSGWKQTEMEYQSQELPKLYNAEMKQCMSEISKNSSDEKISESIQQEEIPKEIVSRVREVVNSKKVFSGDVRIIILDLGGQEIIMKFILCFWPKKM